MVEMNMCNRLRGVTVDARLRIKMDVINQNVYDETINSLLYYANQGESDCTIDFNFYVESFGIDFDDIIYYFKHYNEDFCEFEIEVDGMNSILFNWGSSKLFE